MAWWDLGGTLTSCVAAYKPVGAANYAASKVNLVGNAAFNLTDGTAFPSWNTATGWSFTGSSSQYLTNSSALLTTTPVTIVAKCKLTKPNEVNAIVSICDTAASNSFLLCVSNTNVVRTYIFAGGNVSYADSTAGILNDTSYTGSAVYASATSRSAFLDGSNKGTNTTSRIPSGLDTTFIGVFHNGSGLYYYFDGYIEAVAFYSEAVSDEQILALHNAMNAAPTDDLTAVDYTMSTVTFDKPTLTNASGADNLTAKNFTLTTINFDAPTLVNVVVTPSCRTYEIEAETRTYEIEAETRTYEIEAEMRGGAITCSKVEKYLITNNYNGLVAKDYTLALINFESPDSPEWWWAGGVDPSGCVAAYEAKGAADYAASKINVVQPGVYDLSDGAAYPTWTDYNGWLFSGGSTQYLTIASALLTVTPLTIIAKFKAITSGEFNSLVTICDTAAFNAFVLWISSSNKTDGVTIESSNLSRASSATSITANIWQTGAAVIASPTSRKAYLDGANEGTESTSRTPTGLDTTFIGILHNGSGLYYPFDGYISYVAFYNTVLTPAQILAIHNALDAKDALVNNFVDNAYTTRASRIGYPDYIKTSPAARLVYITSATSVDIETYNDIYDTYPGFTDIGVRVNGTDKTALNLTAMGTSTNTVDLGAGDNKTVEIIAGLQSGDSQDNRIGTYVVGATFNDTATKATEVTEVTTPRIIIYGDSIAVGGNATNPSLQGWAQLVRNAYSGSLVLEARGYRSLYEDGSDAAARTAFTAHIAGLAPTIIWLAIGTNDYGLKKWSSANFGTAYADLLDKLHAALPSAVIYAQTPIARTTETEIETGYGTLGDYRTQIATAVSTRTSYCTLVQGETWTIEKTDTTHPSTTGHAQYATEVKTILGLT